MSKSGKTVSVCLGEKLIPVGTLVFETDGRREASMFRYAAAWLANPVRFALSPSLPLADAPYHASGRREDKRLALPFPIADAAPDSWGRGIIAKAMTSAPTELDYLLGSDDFTRQGALRFLDEDGTPLASGAPAVPRLNHLADLRAMASAYEKDPVTAGDVARKLVGFVGSLGGARPKSSFIDDDDNLAVAKFTSDNDTTPIERVEVATLRLAAKAGITVPETRLELFDTEHPVAIISRFDRRGTARVPYISGQSFTGIDARNGGFYTDIADAMRAHALNPRAQIEELYRRMLFTILVSNNDDHLKNHGFLYAGGGKWVLSPVFDVNPQPERHRHLETGISEISGHAASIEAAIEAATFFDIEDERARCILREVVDAIDANWRVLLGECGLTEAQIRAYAPAFEHEETEKARVILTTHAPAMC